LRYREPLLECPSKSHMGQRFYGFSVDPGALFSIAIGRGMNGVMAGKSQPFDDGLKGVGGLQPAGSCKPQRPDVVRGNPETGALDKADQLYPIIEARSVWPFLEPRPSRAQHWIC